MPYRWEEKGFKDCYYTITANRPRVVPEFLGLLMTGNASWITRQGERYINVEGKGAKRWKGRKNTEGIEGQMEGIEVIRQFA
jgi:hypothetical protein